MTSESRPRQADYRESAVGLLMRLPDRERATPAAGSKATGELH